MGIHFVFTRPRCLTSSRSTIRDSSSTFVQWKTKGTAPNFNLYSVEHHLARTACTKTRNTGTPEHRNTGTPEHRNTGTPEHRNTGTPETRNTPEHRNIPEYRNTGTPEHPGTPRTTRTPNLTLLFCFPLQTM